jgi:hypothetical protein
MMGWLVACGGAGKGGEKRSSGDVAESAPAAGSVSEESNEAAGSAVTDVKAVSGNAPAPAKLSGQLINEKTNQGLAGETLLLVQGERQLGDVVTDSTGRFELVMPLNPGRYMLRLRSDKLQGVLSFQLRGNAAEALKIFAGPR